MLQVTPNCTKAGPCQKTTDAVCPDKQIAARLPNTRSATAAPVLTSRLAPGTQPAASIGEDHFFSVNNSRPVDSPEVLKASFLMKMLVTLLVLVHTAAKIPGVTVSASESRFVIGHESVDFLYLGLARDHQGTTTSHT